MDVPPLLAPAAVLVLWSLIVLMWLAVMRARMFRQAGITLDNIPRGARMSDIDKEVLAYSA
jgi:hypothetical protein